ncbi:VWA domain-containing protein [Candidatus Woesearchaeota archaeon]|nr:VWA domain-containing protein [Candidatus Woesearchaeota archaeon]
MVIFDSLQNDYEEVEVKSAEPIDEISGKLKKDDKLDKLMSSVLQGDKDQIDDGKLILESINQGVGSFTPDLMMKNLVSNYKLANKMYGEVIIRRLTNYSPNYVEKNINIPEFQREIRKNIEENVESLKKKDLVSKENHITDDGLFLSSLVMYTEELDKLIAKGFGEKRKKEKDVHGEKEDTRGFQKSRYKDIAIRRTIKTTIRRSHDEILKEDIKIYDRRRKGKISIIYGLDSSGSMKGDKLATAKKAGVALAFKAIQEKNSVGLIVFGSDIKNVVQPTNDFMSLLRNLTSIRASMETDIEKTIKKSIELFPARKETKHLILLTDALPTKGKRPEEDTMKAVSLARNSGITISVIGIELDKKGEKLAKRITEVGDGKLYRVKDLENIDKVILEDYYSLDA